MPLENETGADPIVFVLQADGFSFKAHAVHLGIQDGAHVEILDGVGPRDVVATAGSHVLRSELMRAEIGGEE
jgi:hypothetical protein